MALGGFSAVLLVQGAATINQLGIVGTARSLKFFLAGFRFYLLSKSRLRRLGVPYT